MNRFLMACVAAGMMTTPAFAQDLDALMPTGDAAAGEAAFGQCATCHIVANAAGETLAGRNARTGPNLYGKAGAVAGTNAEFAAGRPTYSKSMVEAGEAGLIWNEETFVAYVQDPTGFLREYLDDRRARGNMAFKVRDEAEALNLYAYIYSLAPPVDGVPATN